MRLTERVYLVGGSHDLGFGLSDELDCNVYVIDGREELALIDVGAGRGIGRIIENVRADGLRPERLKLLLLTHGHADHAAGAAACHASLRLEVMASPQVATAIEAGDEQATGLTSAREAGLYPTDLHLDLCPVSTRLVPGECVQVGDLSIKVVGTPGHSLGHVAFLLSGAGESALFSGDALFYGGKLALQALPDCDLAASLQTVRRLAGLKFEALFPGHLAFTLSAGESHVAAAMAHIQRLAVPPSI